MNPSARIMEKYKWFIRIDNRTIGPFSSIEIARNRKCDLETPIWRDGFDRWYLIKEVPELLDIIKKERMKSNWWEEDTSSDIENSKKVTFKNVQKEEIALDMMKDPFFFMIIIIILILLLILLASIQK